MSAPPETDVARIRKYCRARVPASFRDQIRVEAAVRGNSVGKEFGQCLSHRARGLGWRQMSAPCEYLQSACGDRVGDLLRASWWHHAVVLARSEQERRRDPVKVRAAVELR